MSEEFWNLNNTLWYEMTSTFIPIGNQPYLICLSHISIFLPTFPHLHFQYPKLPTPADQPTDQQNEQRGNGGEW